MTTLCGATDETPSGQVKCNRPIHYDRWHSEYHEDKLWASWGGGDSHPFTITARCEGCGHPMSDGTWEGPATNVVGMELGQVLPERLYTEWLETQRDPKRIRYNVDHYSPCDEGCKHELIGRIRLAGYDWQSPADPPTAPAFEAIEMGWTVEASWRPVDIRTLGWPHDLREEKLAILCLRCWAGRHENY